MRITFGLRVRPRVFTYLLGQYRGRFVHLVLILHVVIAHALFFTMRFKDLVALTHASLVQPDFWHIFRRCLRCAILLDWRVFERLLQYDFTSLLHLYSRWTTLIAHVYLDGFRLPLVVSIHWHLLLLRDVIVNR